MKRIIDFTIAVRMCIKGSTGMKTLMRHSMPSHLGYIGPGLGGGIIAVVLGLLLSILLAIVAVFWYPIKRVLGLGSKKKETKEAEE